MFGKADINYVEAVHEVFSLKHQILKMVPPRGPGNLGGGFRPTSMEMTGSIQVQTTSTCDDTILPHLRAFNMHKMKESHYTTDKTRQRCK